MCALRCQGVEVLALCDLNDRAGQGAAVLCGRDAPVGEVQRTVSPGRKSRRALNTASHEGSYDGALG